MSHGIRPGPIFGKLKAGQTVHFEGQTLDPKDFVGPDIPGRQVAVCGDTCDSSELSALVARAEGGLDLLCHEATMEGRLWEKCVSVGHSTPAMAVQVETNTVLHLFTPAVFGFRQLSNPCCR